jgi:hypothetical protein
MSLNLSATSALSENPRPLASYQLPGVVWLMIGLVVIVVVWAWGVEPRNRGPEEVAAATV